MENSNAQEIIYRKNYPLKKILELESFNDLRPSKDKIGYFEEDDFTDIAPIFILASSDENIEPRLIGGITEQSIFRDAGLYYVPLPQYAMLVIHRHFESEADIFLERKSLIENSFLNDKELYEVYGIERIKDDSLIAA